MPQCAILIVMLSLSKLFPSVLLVSREVEVDAVWLVNDVAADIKEGIIVVLSVSVICVHVASVYPWVARP